MTYRETLSDEITGMKIVQDCLIKERSIAAKQKEKLENLKIAPEEWMIPFIKPLQIHPDSKYLKVEDGKLKFHGFDISHNLGMYTITFLSSKLYVKEVKEKKFLWFKWDADFYREVHTFAEAMTFLSELVIVGEAKTHVKFVDKFFEEIYKYLKKAENDQVASTVLNEMDNK